MSYFVQMSRSLPRTFLLIILIVYFQLPWQRTMWRSLPGMCLVRVLMPMCSYDCLGTRTTQVCYNSYHDNVPCEGRYRGRVWCGYWCQCVHTTVWGPGQHRFVIIVTMPCIMWRSLPGTCLVPVLMPMCSYDCLGTRTTQVCYNSYHDNVSCEGRYRGRVWCRYWCQCVHTTVWGPG